MCETCLDEFYEESILPIEVTAFERFAEETCDIDEQSALVFEERFADILNMISSQILFKEGII